MGHWTNSAQQILSAASGTVTVVDFDVEIAPGSQVALQDGLYDYAYHINILKPSGEIGPSRVTSVMAVNRMAGGTDTIRESRGFGEIDSGAELSLSHTGRTPLSVGDEVRIRINLDDPSQTGVLDTRIKKGQSSLTLDLVGASASGNFVGNSFPTEGLEPGYQFYRSDLLETFTWTGSKWLGEIRQDGGGRSGNQGANVYFRRYNGQLMTASRGIYIPFNATIVSLSWTKADVNVGNIEIRRDGAAIGSINAGAAGGGTDLDIDFDANGVLSLFWNSAQATSNVQIAICYRRRN